ncbi:MAG: HD domain-containing protein [Candidatus Binatia bacterium]|jgi:uncharacterized protein
MFTELPLFVTERDHPTERVRCPVHGFIHYSVNEEAIVDSRVFQRLRNIRQLALAHYVYPGAMHTRFEHSLGVMELATRAFDVLARKDAALLQETFAQVPAFKEHALAKARQLIRLLGLLHDIGHTAFSHAGECILPNGRHERVSAWVIRQGPLASLLAERFSFFPGLGDILAQMIAEESFPPQLTVLKQIVSGQLDFDRTDYLLRDSLHCGVSYGNFDYLRLIESLAIVRRPAAGSLEIGIEPSGVHAFEGLILARYQMNTQVYYHRLRRIYDVMLERYLKAWGASNYEPEERALEHDDQSLLEQMRQDATADDSPERKRWAQRILRRNHPKLIYETSDHADAEDLDRVKEIEKRLSEDFPGSEIILDAKAKGNVHKLFIRGEEEKVDDLFVVRGGKNQRRVTEQSKILEKVPKGFWVIRLYGYFGGDEQCRRARERAGNLEKTLS